VILCFVSPYEVNMDKFAKLWASYEHVCKAVVTVEETKLADVAKHIVDRCNMVTVQVAGRHCFLS